ncbi:MAG: hypothetical protein IH909_05020 [Proteobacteria bacterium]|nr:hypothetical protein [Pseudomonadota bacterium]
MNYVRTFAGGMMAITPKTNTLIAENKQTAVVKPSRKLKKDSTSESK